METSGALSWGGGGGSGSSCGAGFLAPPRKRLNMAREEKALFAGRLQYKSPSNSPLPSTCARKLGAALICDAFGSALGSTSDCSSQPCLTECRQAPVWGRQTPANKFHQNTPLLQINCLCASARTCCDCVGQPEQQPLQQHIPHGGTFSSTAARCAHELRPAAAASSSCAIRARKSITQAQQHHGRGAPHDHFPRCVSGHTSTAVDSFPPL